MQGWSGILFRRESDGRRITLPMDDLIDCLASLKAEAGRTSMRVVMKLIDRIRVEFFLRWGKAHGFGHKRSAVSWNHEYESGRWAYLLGPEQTERYQQLITLCLLFNKTPTILDVGCGEGILLEYLRTTGRPVIKYVGLDLSQEAINKAKARLSAGQFLVVNAESYKPDEPYDVIVFNECLYYFSDPIKTIRNFEQSIRKHGTFVISMHMPEEDPARYEKIWELLQTHYECVARRTATNGVNKSWALGVFKVRQSELVSDAPQTVPTRNT
jgi:2-polyprenyl-3-methyl-5-hydroxy-6-metoxy-1,4-benzoquinol methylase